MSTPDPLVPPATGPAAPSITGPDRPRPTRSGAGLLALAAAGAALVLAFVSVVLSWRAVDKADQALDRLSTGADRAAAGPGPSQQTSSEGPAEEQNPEAAGPSASGEPKLNPSTRFEPKYSGVTMQVPAGSDCSNTVYIDLDEPRVQTASGVAELEYHRPCGGGTPFISLTSGVDASEVGSDTVTPAECTERIKLSPIAPEEQPLRRGQVYCINTSYDDARASANTWKMVVLTVAAMPQDGSVTLKASAWDIPN